MDKIKSVIAQSIAASAGRGPEPSEQDILEAIGEFVDGVASLTDSLKRIADNTERLAECVETRASEFGNFSSFRTI